MIVDRKPLTFWERLYLPAIIGGLKVTLKHAYSTLIKGKVVTMEYPEQKWTLPANYRGAPYLVKDQEGSTKCVSCQLCEFVCPPKPPARAPRQKREVPTWEPVADKNRDFARSRATRRQELGQLKLRALRKLRGGQTK